MIYLSSDHAGFELKLALITFLKENGHACEDVGALTYDALDDYPDFIIPCCQKVAADPTSFGLVIGGSGQGEAIAANKVPGIRAALFYGGNPDILTLSKQHNNANVLSLGARFLTTEEAKSAVQLWLATSFTHEDRHVRRLEKITKFESRSWNFPDNISSTKPPAMI